MFSSYAGDLFLCWVTVQPAVQRPRKRQTCNVTAVRSPFKVWTSIARMSYEVLCFAVTSTLGLCQRSRKARNVGRRVPPFHSQISSLMLCWSMPSGSLWRPLVPQGLHMIITMLSHEPTMLPLKMAIYGVVAPGFSVLGDFFLSIRYSSKCC